MPKKHPKFCLHQTKVTYPDYLACGIGLRQDKIFKCPYKESDIYVDKEEEKLSIAHHTKTGELVSVCDDFTPTEQSLAKFTTLSRSLVPDPSKGHHHGAYKADQNA
jgi:hypothetical protein